MTVFDVATVACLLAGTFFFLAGTVGILRFPDSFTRLHAVTKADNLGLGLVVLGLIFQTSSILGIAKLLLIWTMVLVASAASCYLVAGYADGEEREGGSS